MQLQDENEVGCCMPLHSHPQLVPFTPLPLTPSLCLVHPTPQMQDRIKGADSLTGWTLESHTRGMEALRCYTSTGDCRHACLVNFFQPEALNVNGPCTGGCDNCTRRCAGCVGV
jgi:hypothetical protein